MAGVGKAREVLEFVVGGEERLVLQQGEGALEEVQAAREDDEYKAVVGGEVGGGAIEEGADVEDGAVVQVLIG